MDRMDRDEAAAIIHRMMRQLEEETGPKGAPRCDGCARRVELAPYHRRLANGGSETLYYCAECRTLAMVEVVEDGEL